MALALGYIFRVVFPEDQKLAMYAHSPNVDVVMAVRLMEYFFARAPNADILNKITYYFRPRVTAATMIQAQPPR